MIRGVLRTMLPWRRRSTAEMVLRVAREPETVNTAEIVGWEANGVRMVTCSDGSKRLQCVSCGRWLKAHTGHECSKGDRG